MVVGSVAEAGAMVVGVSSVVDVAAGLASCGEDGGGT
jgi:hypothetical protein